MFCRNFKKLNSIIYDSPLTSQTASLGFLVLALKEHKLIKTDSSGSDKALARETMSTFGNGTTGFPVSEKRAQKFRIDDV